VSRTARLVLFLVAGTGTAAILVLAVFRLPHFGTTDHPYRDAAVPAAVRHATANVISSINFDLRGLDTLGEETILLASVIGAAVLLRPADDEEERPPTGGGPELESTRLFGTMFLPVTLVIGLLTVAHGALTPGGGFQGGVVLATAPLAVYLAMEARVFLRIAPEWLAAAAEGAGAAGFVALGAAGVVAGRAFLENVLPLGKSGTLASSGMIALLNTAVALEVSAAFVLLFTEFLEELMVERPVRV
jgi:multicomponent Na+:H+ antiporter subunit B